MTNNPDSGLSRVISVDFGKKQILSVEEVAGHIVAGVEIYLGNLGREIEHAADFLKEVMEKRFVYIDSGDQALINENSIMYAGDMSLTVGYFLRIIVKNYKKIPEDYIEESLMIWLTEREIVVQMKVEDNESFASEELLLADLDTYRPEEIRAFEMVEGKMLYNYDVRIVSTNEKDGELYGFGEVADFEIDKDVSLLDMIACAFDDMEFFEGYDPDDYTVLVTRDEGDFSDEKRIPYAVMQKLLYASLMRMNGAKYGPHDVQTALRIYFSDEVMAKLSGHKMKQN